MLYFVIFQTNNKLNCEILRLKLTSVHEVTLLSENPWIVILTGLEELNPAASSPVLSPKKQIIRDRLEIEKNWTYFDIFQFNFVPRGPNINVHVICTMATTVSKRVSFWNRAKLVWLFYLNSVRHWWRTLKNLLNSKGPKYMMQIKIKNPSTLITCCRLKYITFSEDWVSCTLSEDILSPVW